MLAVTPDHESSGPEGSAVHPDNAISSSSSDSTKDVSDSERGKLVVIGGSGSAQSGGYAPNNSFLCVVSGS